MDRRQLIVTVGLSSAALIGLGVWAGQPGSGPAKAGLAEAMIAAAPMQSESPRVAPPPASQPPTHEHPQPPTGEAVLGPPPIEFDPPAVDLGTLKPGEKKSATVRIINISDKWLKILQSKADCTCTAVNLANQVMAPGESVALQADYRASSTMGDKKAAVRVLIEGYDVVEFPIKAFITLPIKPEPTYINALFDENNLPVSSGEYTLTSLDGQPFRILSVNDGPVPYVDFDPAVEQPQATYRLKWDFTSYDTKTCTDANGNKLPAFMIIETDRPDCSIFDLEVRSECTRRGRPTAGTTWMVGEKRELIGDVSSGKPVEFELIAKFLKNAPHDDVVKTVVSESPKQFGIELLGVETTTDDMRVKLRVTPNPTYRGLINGTIRLHSSRQSVPFSIIGAARTPAPKEQAQKSN